VCLASDCSCWSALRARCSSSTSARSLAQASSAVLALDSSLAVSSSQPDRSSCSLRLRCSWAVSSVRTCSSSSATRAGSIISCRGAGGSERGKSQSRCSSLHETLGNAIPRDNRANSSRKFSIPTPKSFTSCRACRTVVSMFAA
jgi:hypothetical protein